VKTIRGGKGIGDALYVQAVARHLTQGEERLKVATPWPEVFLPLNGRVQCIPFRRDKINILAHYSARRAMPTGQFEDVCLSAGLRKPVELRIDWTIQDHALVDRLKQHGKPIVLVQLPRAPMGRTDGFGAELLPDGKAIQRAIDRLRERCLLVQVGRGEALFRLRGLHIDLANETTVTQLLDLGAACSGVVGYVSFILPLAESMGKPGLMIWSRKGLRSGQAVVRHITPQKVVHRKDLIRSVRDAHDDPIEAEADAFLQQ
jgi:hypothetical protein